MGFSRKSTPPPHDTKLHKLITLPISHPARALKLVKTILNHSILDSLIQDLDKSMLSTQLVLKMLPTWI
jgi:hypothetical protein